MMKDPALMVYTKDFLEGTADLSAEEFGAFTRLIFHQHQRGVLPNNLKKLARLSGVSYSEFEEIWKEIHAKFTLSDTGYVNKRCAEEIFKRSQNSVKKSIIAVFGNWVKANNDLSKQTILKVKKAFSIEEFLNIENEEERKEKILEVLNKLTKANTKGSLAYGNANVDVNVNEDKNVVVEVYPTFDDFWNEYDKKVGRKDKIKKKWDKLPQNIKEAIMNYIPKYKIAQPEKKYRKNPETFFNNESWKDEIVNNETKQSNNNTISKSTIYSEDFYRKHASGFSSDGSQQGN